MDRNAATKGGDSLLFSQSPQEVLVIDLERMKGWVDLGVTQRFWAQGPWIGNVAHMSIIAPYHSIQSKEFYFQS